MIKNIYFFRESQAKKIFFISFFFTNIAKRIGLIPSLKNFKKSDIHE